MIIVSDTGPLIALAKIDQLNLLKQLMPNGVLIPPVIQRELWAKTGFESAALQSALEDFIQIRLPQRVPDTVDVATMHLDEGEKQAIRLAASTQEATLLLLDDKAGRSAAKQLGLLVTGTIGILLQAKQKALITNVTPLLEELRKCDYWLSDNLISYVCKEAGE